jgi:hypothetical protein
MVYIAGACDIATGSALAPKICLSAMFLLLIMIIQT